MKLRNIKNIQLIHIAIILAICILIIFTCYQNNSTKHKVLDISIKQENITKLPKEYSTVEYISDSQHKITCKIDKSYLDETKYTNYTEGPGVGRKVNFSIIIKQEENFYKIKTLGLKETDENIYLVGYINSKDLVKGYEILLLNNENGKIYQYIGGTNEEYM